MFGAGECRIGRRLVAHHEPDSDVVRRAVPDHGRAGFDRVFERDHGRQRFIIDHDQLGGIARLLQGFRHHKGDAVADRAHLAARQDRPQRAVSFRPAHVFGHDRHEAANLIGLDIGSGEHGENTGGRLGFRRVDTLDARVSVRRHDQNAVALERHVDVVDKAAAAGDEAGILEPRNRLADTKFGQALSPQNEPLKRTMMRVLRSLVLPSELIRFILTIAGNENGRDRSWLKALDPPVIPPNRTA